MASLLGKPRAAWAADTIRHNRAQPARFLASRVTRYRASTTWAPPQHRGTAAGCGAGERVRGDGDLDAEDRPDTGAHSGVREPHRPGDGVPVGQRESADAPLRRPAYEIRGQGCAGMFEREFDCDSGGGSGVVGACCR